MRTSRIWRILNGSSRYLVHAGQLIGQSSGYRSDLVACLPVACRNAAWTIAQQHPWRLRPHASLRSRLRVLLHTLISAHRHARVDSARQRGLRKARDERRTQRMTNINTRLTY